MITITISTGVLVTLGLAAVGFVGWLTSQSMALGRIRGILETRLDGQDKRISSNTYRIGTLEGRKT